MAKSLFQSAQADVKKKRVFMISVDLINKLQEIEIKAEKHGVSFPLNKHVEDAVTKLVNAAEKELQVFESEPETEVDESEKVVSESGDDLSLGVDDFNQ